MGKYIELNGELFSLDNIAHVSKSYSKSKVIKIHYYRYDYFTTEPYKDKEEMEKDYKKLKNELFLKWAF